MTTMQRSESLVAWAERTAMDLLSDMRPRVDHVLAVGAKARRVAERFERTYGELLIASAYLHDIGYAPELVNTGLHQIDGARWLASQGRFDLAALVAHHSAAHVELRLRGQLHLLDPYEHPPRKLADALAYCDITTGPTGASLPLGERIEEVGDRRGRNSVVYGALVEAQLELRTAVERTGGAPSKLALLSFPWVIGRPAGGVGRVGNRRG